MISVDFNVLYHSSVVTISQNNIPKPHPFIKPHHIKPPYHPTFSHTLPRHTKPHHITSTHHISPRNVNSHHISPQNHTPSHPFLILHHHSTPNHSRLFYTILPPITPFYTKPFQILLYHPSSHHTTLHHTLPPHHITGPLIFRNGAGGRRRPDASYTTVRKVSGESLIHCFRLIIILIQDFQL